MRNLLAWIVCTSVTLLPSLGQQFVIDTTFFEFDEASLKQEFTEKIDSLVSSIQSYPNYYIEIFGHTDSIGTEVYNQQLSELRAKAVVNYLVDKGLNVNRIAAKGFGTQKPAAPNDTFWGRSKNRRADIAVIYTDQEGLASLGEGLGIFDESGTAGTNRDGSDGGQNGNSTGTDADGNPLQDGSSGDMDLSGADGENANNPVDLVDTIYADYNPFSLRPAAQTYVYTPQGAKIVIPPSSFETDKESINFEVNELLSRKDILLSGMPTVSKDGPLETLGMISLEATDRGRRVRIKGDKPILIEFPVVEQEEGVALYEGKGGERGSRRASVSGAVSGFRPVVSWILEDDIPLAFNNAEDHYSFSLTDLGRINLARPLFVAEGTDKEDEGFDVFVKLKGKRFEKNTTVFVVSQEHNAFVPLRKESKRNYEESRVRFFDPESNLTLVAIQYDNDDEPYLATKSISLSRQLRQGKKDPRPFVYIKAKFKKADEEEFIERLEDI